MSAGAAVRLACIDIGSNTTRLLLADVGPSGLEPVAQQRAFTSLGSALEVHGSLPEEKLTEVLEVVRTQLSCARDLGAREVHLVATAAVRRAPNGRSLIERLHGELGLQARVLAPSEEARLAFIGAVASRPAPAGAVAVVDLGGGSCELAVGSPPAAVRWSISLPLGSASVTARYLSDDPPSPGQLRAARHAVRETLAGLDPPPVGNLLAVGGSATSLSRIGGGTLDRAALARLLDEAAACPSAELARRYELERERARLMPGGLLILGMLAERLGRSLQIGAGGVREGVLIEAGGLRSS